MLASIVIDRLSALPLYAQLEDRLRQAISSGLLPPGSKLPAEEELSRTLGLSRATVRQALGDLSAEGRIQKIHGRGTFVTEPRVSLHIGYRLISFAEDMAQAGHQVQTRVLEIDQRLPTEDVSRALQLGPHQKVVYLRRLRSLDGAPFMIDSIQVRADLCPGLDSDDFASRSLFSILEQDYSIRIHHANRSLTTAAADAYAAELLGVAIGDPLHRLTDLAFDLKGRAVFTAVTLVHGARSEFRFELIDTTPGLTASPPRPANPSLRNT